MAIYIIMMSLGKSLLPRSFISNNSDTETIPKAYLQYGFGFEKKLRGMFSIVIWNNNDKRLIVSRDRFGIKPLFKCTLVNGDIIYSSELGPIIFMLGGCPD